ncbi:MAG: Cys/Met metabolism pyridoxal-phosphate-dependent enzyme [Campylobacter sp.]|nr:Cys/Met metabolism pyridoxal-phosphate-dependent enzyme [Campylobacter sp.]
MTNLLSITRRPADHFLSGAIIAGIGSVLLNAKDCKDDLPKLGKKALKASVLGGITAYTAIHASNCIANGHYLDASTTIALGVGGVLLVDKFKA